jgi:HflK protein
MNLLTEYLTAVISMFAEAAPFLLVGFVVAGLIRELVPGHKVYRHLGGDRFRSVGLASLIGIPLPLCSCSVLPTAAALRKSGASKGATTSFLISTPETGADSIGLTWALLDPFMTIMRPIAALVTAVLTGTLVNRLVTAGLDDDPDEEEEPDCCGANALVTGEVERPERRSAKEVVRRAGRWAFGPLVDDLAQWLLLGFLVSGAIAVAVPDDFISESIPNGWIAGLIMVIIGTPMYICAAAATPLAAALIAKGLDPGAALVLLLVGPATNVSTALVILKMLGKRVLAVYLVGVIGTALLLGAFVSDWYAGSGMSLATTVAGNLEEGASWVEVLCGALMAAAVIRSMRRTRMLSAWGRRLKTALGPVGLDPTSRVGKSVVILLVVAIYLSSAFSVVSTGEVAWVVRFGKVVRQVDEPGLAVHWPWPVDRTVVIPKEELRTVELGFVRGESAFGDSDGPDRMADPEIVDQSELVTGEEDVLRVGWTVHYDVKGPYRFRYRVADADRLVGAFTEAALRSTISHRKSGEVLTGHRDELERETLANLQRELDALDSGIRVVDLRLLDVHAAPKVHWAYREVASSLEDREREILLAEGLRTEMLADARAAALRAETAGEAYREEKVNHAGGEAAGFESRLEAYLESKAVTRFRLRIAALEEALGKARAVFLLGSEVDVELWSTGGKRPPKLPDK